MTMENIYQDTRSWMPFDLSLRLYNSLKLLRLIPCEGNASQPIKAKQIPGYYVITFLDKGYCQFDIEINVSRLVDLGIRMPKEVKLCVSLIKEAIDYHDMIRNKLKYEKEAKQ